MKKEKNIKEKVIIMDYLHDLMMNKGIKNAIINVDENVVYINHDNYGNTNYGCQSLIIPKKLIIWLLNWAITIENHII